VDGLLIPPEDVNALAKGMDRLMSNPLERQRLGTSAMEVAERFSIEKIMSMWDELVAHACRRGLGAEFDRSGTLSHRKQAV
jgi:glycosyltransferase involved in cell wall biosynthesis